MRIPVCFICQHLVLSILCVYVSAILIGVCSNNLMWSQFVFKTNEVQHLFVGLFAICMSLVKYLFHLWPIELGGFLAVEF